MPIQYFNPEMLVLARESRGVTQSELAQALGISQSNVSKTEAGLLAVPPEQVDPISKFLNYPESFFYQRFPPQGFASNCLYHRKRQSVSVADLRRIIAMLKITRLQLTVLLQGAEIETENRIHRMDIIDFGGQAELIAQLVRRSWGLPPGPIDNLTVAIESAGGIIVSADFGTRKIDAMSQWALALPPLIFVNKDVPGDRLRFSLAHEIGHLIMHQIPTANIEGEADRFAAEFLMPAADVEPYLHGLTLARLAQLKEYWKVSMAALLMRAGDLGCITPRQQQYLWTQMSKNGYRLREPVEVPTEEPKVINEIISLHLSELKYTPSELCALIRINEMDFREKYLPPTHSRKLRIVG